MAHRLQRRLQPFASRGANDRTETVLVAGLPPWISSSCCDRIKSRNVACASISASRSASPPTSESAHSRQPRRRRALQHMVPDRQRTRRRDDAEQSGALQIDAALARANASEKSDAALDRARRLRQAASRNSVCLWRRQGVAPQRVGEPSCPWTPRMIEENVDRQQVLRPRTCDPVRDPRAARSRPSRARRRCCAITPPLQ